MHARSRGALRRSFLFILVSFSIIAPSRAQEDFIYWVNESDQTLMRGRIDGTAVETVIKHRMPHGLPSGVYLYLLEAGSYRVQRRMVLVR